MDHASSVAQTRAKLIHSDSVLWIGYHYLLEMGYFPMKLLKNYIDLGLIPTYDSLLI